MGVTGAIIGAGVGMRATRDATTTSVKAETANIMDQIKASSNDIQAQIKADRDNRVWENRSSVYIDALSGLLHRMRVRDGQREHMTTDAEPEHPPAPVAWPMVEARLLAYASRNVLTALSQASDADSQFGAAFRMWLMDYARAKAAQGSAHQLAGDDKANMMDALEKATAMDDTLMNIIRAQLNAGPGSGL